MHPLKAFALTFAVLALFAVAGCQWGSGNVTTGPLYIVKQFINCEDARSGLATVSEGQAQGGLEGEGEGGISSGSGSGRLDTASVFAGSLGAEDRCTTAAPAPDYNQADGAVAPTTQ